jgi:hypothetical protein
MEYEDERRMPPAQTARRGIVPETTSLAEAREFSMAITHIEDAITRFNKGTYMARGTFAISDAERS